MKYGRYQVVDELGKGTMGVVYKAHDPHIDRAVALKVLRKDRVTSDEFVKRFLTEAKAIGRLSHPGIVTVYDVGQENDVVYIAEEFVEGRPLNRIMGEDRLSPGKMAEIGAQVAEALDYAHAKGIIHRDIKPPNIIITPDQRVIITDFGIARIEDSDMARLTRAGVILGTPMYMSPEQVAGEQLDGRSDLYSLGVILYQLSTRKRPSWGRDLGEIFKSILDHAPEAPGNIDPSIPGPLSDVIMKSLEKSPESRYRTGGEMAEALRACISSDASDSASAVPGQAAAAPEDEPREAGLKKTWSPGRFIVIGLIAACIACVVLLFFPKAGKKEESPKPAATRAVGMAPPRPPDAETPRGTLTLKSDPPGARVFLNGALEGKTPMDIRLPFGEHRVRLKLKNHSETERYIELNKEKETLILKLDPL